MGNSSNKLPWRAPKLFKKENKKKDSKKKKSEARRVNSAPLAAPMYDTVTDVPLYSVVDKSRKRKIKAEDNVQYAEVEVVRRPPPQSGSQKKSPVWQTPETTEYATISFNPQENYPGKGIPAQQQQRSVHHGGPAAHIKPPRRYNSVNGTLV